jgi:signal transduction histidine kinase
VTPDRGSSPVVERVRARFALRRILADATQPRLWLLTAAVFASVAMAIFAVVTLRRQAAALAELPNVVELPCAVRALATDALAAESAQRGYLLTGELKYLAGFTAWHPAAQLREVRASMRAANTADLAELETLLDGKQREMQRTLVLHDAGHHDEALRLVRSDLGKSVMDRMRVVMDRMIRRERRQTDELFDANGNVAQVAMPMIIVGTTVTVLALLAALFIIRRSTLALAVAATENASQAGRLEEHRLALNAGLVAMSASNRALERSNRDLDQFAYVASHDLKAPLRAISSLATWLEEDLGDQPDARTGEHLRLMRSRVDRMGALIEGILGYSRAGRNGETVEVDVRVLVSEAREQSVIPPGVTIEISPGPWPVLQTQRVQFMQVWSNLVSNAVKYGVPSGGCIRLGCALDPQLHQLCFSVHDDGVGIDPAYHERIFELFQRLISRDQVEGTGIGLSIVRKLIDGNGGKIWVDSAPGAGTTFTFTWSSHVPS